MTRDQEKWHATDLEGFAVVEACDHFSTYLLNNNFTILTDHSALQWVDNNENLKFKLHRWFVRLSCYNKTIKHRKGSEQQHVDALSRASIPLDSTRQKKIYAIQPDDEVLVLTANPATDLAVFKAQQEYDMTFIKAPIIIRDIFHVKINGTNRIVLPPSLHDPVINHYHRDYGHPGVLTTTALVKSKYWWPNYAVDVAKFVRRCKECQMTKSRNHPTYGELQPLLPAKFPMERIGIDTVIMGRSAAATKAKYIMVFIDHHTRFVWAFPTASNDAQATVTCLEKIIGSAGAPKIILTDNGTNFTSNTFRNYLKKHDIHCSNSSPYHPQTCGHVEKVNHTLITRLRVKLMEKPQLKWSSLLPSVVSEYNMTPHTITGFSPFFLMFGRQPDMTSPETEISVERAREISIERTSKNQDQRKDSYDKQHKPLKLSPDDMVVREIASNHPSLKKLTPRFEGPFRVLEIIGPNAVKIARYNDDPSPRIVNISQLRRFIAEDDASLVGGLEASASSS